MAQFCDSCPILYAINWQTEGQLFFTFSHSNAFSECSNEFQVKQFLGNYNELQAKEFLGNQKILKHKGEKWTLRCATK